MGHDTGRVCKCMVTHRPHPLELHAHHVLPMYLGGPDDPINLVWLCPTAHTNVHELLRHMLRADRAFTNHELGVMYDVPVSEYAARIARAGFNAYAAHRGTAPLHKES